MINLQDNEKEKIYNNLCIKSFILGFVTNVFNPKATLFFLSLFTLVIDSNTPLSFQLFYGSWMTIITGVWFCIVSIFFTSEYTERFITKYAVHINRLMGVILIFISIILILN